MAGTSSVWAPDATSQYVIRPETWYVMSVFSERDISANPTMPKPSGWKPMDVPSEELMIFRPCHEDSPNRMYVPSPENRTKDGSSRSAMRKSWRSFSQSHTARKFEPAPSVTTTASCGAAGLTAILPVASWVTWSTRSRLPATGSQIRTVPSSPELKRRPLFSSNSSHRGTPAWPLSTIPRVPSDTPDPKSGFCPTEAASIAQRRSALLTQLLP